jgi:two-component system sensor histidine kinase RegB
MPLPWYPGFRIQLPFLFKLAVLAAIVSSMVFLAFYAWRLAVESSQMSSALSATELVLAREQKLHALDGLAAAAAHELGTPLSTIVLVTKELSNDKAVSPEMQEDFELLRSQADRCREILQKLTRAPSAQDPMHSSLSALELIDEAASPYRERGKSVAIRAVPPPPDSEANVVPEPAGIRQPGVIYGLGNLIENAVDFARSQVEVSASWTADTVSIEVVDDGPGFPPELMDSLGDPYVTSRAASSSKRSSSAGGLGLGFFIAKSLLERSGASVNLSNRTAPDTGAIVTVIWPRDTFEHPSEEFTSAL